jgi:hypothetical protein
MFAALSLAILAAIPQVPARQDRASFVEALSQVKEGWTKGQVEELLGKADDVWPETDPPVFSPFGREIWCYGSKGHHSLPTLGRVEFDHEKVASIEGGEGKPPSTQVIDESTLDASLRVVHLWPNPDKRDEHQTAHVLKVANYLISLGQDKAVAVLAEYGRLMGYYALRDEGWPFWLVRVAFEPTAATGAFREPGIGYIMPAAPEDLRRWPTYPILIVDDFPLNFEIFTHKMGGGFESFQAYVEEDSKNWKLRTKMLSPPDNPFLLREKVLADPTWAVIQESAKQENPYGVRGIEEGAIFAAIGDGVSSAFTLENGLSWTQTTKKFRELGCRWDAKRNCYVRGDGTTLSNEVITYPSVSHEFKGIPRLKVEVRMSRTKATQLSIQTTSSESGTDLIAPAALIFVDEATKKQLSWMRLTGHEKVDSTNMNEFFKRTVEEFLAFPPHESFAGTMMSGSEFDLAFGTKIRLVVLTNGQRYEGPVFAP